MQVKKRKWLLGASVLLALLGVAWIALLVWLPTDEELAAKAGAELESRLGVPVKIGALHWSLFPTPAVVVSDAVTEQPQPITIRRLTLHPNIPALMDGRFRLDSAELVGAVVPQLSLRALDKEQQKTGGNPDATLLERFVFRDVTWITRRGIPVVYDGEIDFDPNWRPRRAEIRRPDFKPATDLVLTRQGEEDRWDARVRVGGGTADGEVQLQTRDNGRMHLDGQLKPRAVEVSSALAAFNRKSVVAGEASGDTALSADGDTFGELAQSLHTRTAFSMGRSTLLRFDLDKAVRSFGKEHEGQTPLDAITGRLDTQNTVQGMVVTYTGLKASSGALTASGDVKIANRRIDAEFAVDLVDGIVGVPLRLTGPLDKVEVSVPKSAVAGAVIGTAVLPGVGTAIGARIGATLGKIFSPDPAPEKGAAATPGRKPPP